MTRVLKTLQQNGHLQLRILHTVLELTLPLMALKLLEPLAAPPLIQDEHLLQVTLLPVSPAVASTD
ncbi:MAG: hypothetical protein CVU78_07525 [Elusimicrobia bacterium HGW-Elusimicrobia-2]|nr:MAG: hypothetical protein CVU78_07525 [Elusimicrobia bacterium HGW-Elusimicrobia-2]